jgi:hypothetical protein
MPALDQLVMCVVINCCVRVAILMMPLAGMLAGKPCVQHVIELINIFLGW